MNVIGMLFAKHKKLKLIGLLLITAAVVYAVYRFAFPTTTNQADQDQTVTVTRGEIAPTMVVSGVIEAQEQVELNFKSGGTLATIDVEVGDKVKIGQRLASVDDIDMKKQLRLAKADYDSAKAQMRQLKKASSSDLATQEITVNKAGSSLSNTQMKTTNTQSSAIISVATAQTDVDNAKRDMDQLQIKRDEAVKEWQDLVAKYEHPVYHLPNYTDAQEKEVDAAKTAADSAYDKLIAAQDKYNKALQSLNTAKLQSELQNNNAANDLVQSQAQYDTAQIQLDSLKTGPNADDKIIQRAKEIAAEENYYSAQRSLDDSILTAPINGTVLSIDSNVGEEVSGGGLTTSASTSGSGSAFITIANKDGLIVTASVDQADIAKVKKGQKAEISVDAFPDQTLKGTVINVDPNPVIEQNVVTYKISVLLEKPDPKIQLGMAATVNIDLGKKNNVLIVPNLAVKSSNGSKFVTKNIDGSPTQIRVETGLADDQFTEITSGLNEGDVIVISTLSGSTQSGQNTGTQQNSQRSLMPGPGGGGFVPGMGGRRE